MSKIEHKHAAVLRAIADGVPLSEFEASKNEVYWASLALYKLADFSSYDIYIRRKPQHIMVNGFKVPKPLETVPVNGDEYYVTNPTGSNFFEKYEWKNDHIDSRLFARKMAHNTKQAAIAHAKAMLGINPEVE